jgi:DNA-binding transcriptional LysR family regulator
MLATRNKNPNSPGGERFLLRGEADANGTAGLERTKSGCCHRRITWSGRSPGEHFALAGWTILARRCSAKPLTSGLAFVETGRLLSIFPASALRFPANHPETRELSVELPLARVPVGIVTLKNCTMGPVARLFMEHAREIAKPLAKKK